MEPASSKINSKGAVSLRGTINRHMSMLNIFIGGILLQFVGIGNRRDHSSSGLLVHDKRHKIGAECEVRERGSEERALSPNYFPVLQSHGILSSF